MMIEENVSLAPLTTLQVGGPARYFAQAQTEEQVREALNFAKSHNLPLLVLGGGSNLLISDKGWDGLVLRVAIVHQSVEPSGPIVLFSAGAGLDWDYFVGKAVAENCAGVECLSGIPGSVGGTPVQNVGAYGQEVADTIDSVRALDTKEGRTVVLGKTECKFRYRRSIFNTSQRGRYIILDVTYRLERGGKPLLKYADLQKHFSGAQIGPSLAEVREAVRQIRRSKGMLIVPGDEDSRSAGSFFKNPLLTRKQLNDLTERANAMALTIPSYPALEARHKVSAAWLVEHSGFTKGFRLGAARISTKHALALVNAGNAHASDIIRLKDAIQHGVEKTWGIHLEPEPVFVGF
jgi:UDP-N-acetylmuramate dehydrogenase